MSKQRASEAGLGLDVISLQPKRRLEFPRGALQVVLGQQRIPEVVVRLRQVRFQPERFAVLGDSAVHIPLALERSAEV